MLEAIPLEHKPNVTTVERIFLEKLKEKDIQVKKIVAAHYNTSKEGEWTIHYVSKTPEIVAATPPQE